jgi:hypothetical protein
MGIDCSNCKCTNRDDEKILIIENYTKVEGRRSFVLNERNKSKKQMNEILEQNPGIIDKIILLQSLIRKYKYSKIYKAILEKYRVRQTYFSYDEMKETLGRKRLRELTVHEMSYTYKSGAIYSGQWLGGFRHSRGLMKWKDGSYYEGEWNLGYAEGKGMLVYMNGDFLKGDFMYNKLNGYGECFNSELGYEYKGYWENDLQCGQGRWICDYSLGTETWPDGSEFIGLYELGKKDGFGKYNWADGSYYIGEWKDNKIHGLVRQCITFRVSITGRMVASSQGNGSTQK